MNALTIRHAILRVLALAEPHPLPQGQLLAQVNELLRPTLAPAELTTHLSWLLDHALVDFLADAMDPENPEARQWLIRAPGLAALRR